MATANGSKATTASNESTGADTAAIQAQLDTLQKDVSQLTKVLAEYGRAQKDHVTGAARDKADHVRGQAEAAYTYADTEARAAYAQAESKVRDNPAASVAIASGVGFLIGLLMSRR